MFKLVLFVTASIFLRNVMSESCSQIASKPFIDMDKMIGAWYGVQSVHNIPACEIFKLKQGSIPFNYVLNTETRIKTSDDQYKTLCSENLEAIDLGQPGRMRVSPLSRVTGMTPYKSIHVVGSNFTVVATDYETYAVITRSDGLIFNSISHQNNSFMCSSSTQIWSRFPALSESFIQKIKTIQSEFGDLDTLLFNFDDTQNKTGCVASDEPRIVEIDIFEKV